MWHGKIDWLGAAPLSMNPPGCEVNCRFPLWSSDGARVVYEIGYYTTRHKQKYEWWCKFCNNFYNTTSLENRHQSETRVTIVSRSRFVFIELKRLLTYQQWTYPVIHEVLRFGRTCNNKKREIKEISISNQKLERTCCEFSSTYVVWLRFSSTTVSRSLAVGWIRLLSHKLDWRDLDIFRNHSRRAIR